MGREKVKIREVIATYETICPLWPPETGHIINAHVLLDKCKVCRYFVKFNLSKLTVSCRAKRD